MNRDTVVSLKRPLLDLKESKERVKPAGLDSKHTSQSRGAWEVRIQVSDGGDGMRSAVFL